MRNHQIMRRKKEKPVTLSWNQFADTLENMPQKESLKEKKNYALLREEISRQIGLVIDQHPLIKGFREILESQTKKMHFKLVGGVPRDVAIAVIEKKDDIATIAIEDFDLTTNCNEKKVIELLELLKNKKEFQNLKYQKIGTYFPIISVSLPDTKETLEISLDQFYHQKDYLDRDFNCNCLSYDLIKKTISDPHFGLPDLTKRMIYCVTDPRIKVTEGDHLLALRAIYLSKKTGMGLEKNLLDEIKKLKFHPDFGMILTQYYDEKTNQFLFYKSIVMPRLFNYLAKMLRGKFYESCLETLVDFGLLSRILPNCKETCLHESKEKIIEIVKNTREEIENEKINNNDEINATLYLSFYFEKFKKAYQDEEINYNGAQEKEMICALQACNKTFGNDSVLQKYRFPKLIKTKMLERAMKTLGLSEEVIAQASNRLRNNLSAFFPTAPMPSNESQIQPMPSGEDGNRPNTPTVYGSPIIQ